MRFLEPEQSSDERKFAEAWIKEQNQRIAILQVFALAVPMTALVKLNDAVNVRIAEVRTLIDGIAILYILLVALAIMTILLRRPGLSKATALCVPAFALILTLVMARYAYLAELRADAVIAAFPDTERFSPKSPYDLTTDSLSESTLAGVAFLVFCTSTISLAQVSLAGLSLLSLSLLAALYPIFADHTLASVNIGAGTSVIIGAAAAGFARMLGQRRSAFAELQRRMLAEREAVLDYEKELEVARRIQDSILPPTFQRFRNDIAVHSYRESHATIGGDWLGLHETPERALVIAVGDVSGKGVHAALTAHAVQSVWTVETELAHFDPARFLARVNGTLSVLGQKRIQSATMGVLVIVGHEIEYWSAAHCGLQLMVHAASGLEHRVLKPEGQPLGVSDDLGLTSVRALLPATERASLLVGTDGVFDALPEAGADVVTLLERLRAHGIEIVRQLRSADDKTLIWLEYNPSLREGEA